MNDQSHQAGAGDAVAMGGERAGMAGAEAQTVRLCKSPKCRKPLIQREDECASHFKRRDYCNRGCANCVRGPKRRDARCIICNEQARRDTKGHINLTCGKPACVIAARRPERVRQKIVARLMGCDPDVVLHWPRVTGDDVPPNYFAAFNEDPGDGGSFWRKSGTVDRQSYVGCSAATAAGV